LFDGNEEETLDHVVPWRIVGDIGEGTNWQVICRSCNIGKASYMSTLQTLEAQNWIYSESDIENIDVRLRTRYALLMQGGYCSHTGCCATPRTSRLTIIPRFPDFLPIADHHRVVCEGHVN
jgi:hypothetical protein